MLSIGLLYQSFLVIFFGVAYQRRDETLILFLCHTDCAVVLSQYVTTANLCKKKNWPHVEAVLVTRTTHSVV